MTDEEVIATFKREGMFEGLQLGAELLNSDDGLNHGVKGWLRLALEEVRSKRIRHLSQAGTEDENSGMDHAVHGLTRLIQELVLMGERR